MDDVKLQRVDGKAIVTGHVRWHANSVTAYRMDTGELRLVAISDQGHLPVLLGKDTLDLSTEQTGDVKITVTDEAALAAMRQGNRIVLTASQHQSTGQVSLSNRTYVTVAEVQPFGSIQPNIGREDCSGIPIVPGALLRHCDLMGAYLDYALVSVHDPKSSEGKRPSRSTRLERADLTGATAFHSDFSGASIAGGRLNGVDMRRAKLDNLSLAGAEAIELNARGATSDKDARDSGGNFFRTNLEDADLRDTVFRGISVGRARLDGAKIQGATWEAIADGATFRGADLTGAKMGTAHIDYADFTDAILTGTTFTDIQLAWTWLCRTSLPSGSVYDGSRDCHSATERQRLPFPTPDRSTPYVTVVGDITRVDSGALNVNAQVTWHADSAKLSGYGMTTGDLRLVAVADGTGVATVLDTQSYAKMTAPGEYSVTISDPAKLAAMARGNRIVLTATQHAPRPRGDKTTTRSYVTVNVLQRGPGLGQIGRLDCSTVALVSESATALDFCDFSGAMLDKAAFNGRFMRQVDLSGATMQDAALTAVALSGARLGGLKASGVAFTNVSAFDAWAPEADLSRSVIQGSPLYIRNLEGADFTRAKVIDSPLVAASLRRAVFSNALLTHPDLAYSDLTSAKLDGVNASLSNPSLFLANLTHADMSGSRWNVDESGDLPPKWATLCDTTMPDPDYPFKGDRDCPR